MINPPSLVTRCNEWVAPIIAPSLVYLILTLLVWSGKVAYDIFMLSPTKEMIWAQCISNAFGMVQYVILYFLCKPHLRRTFCSLVIKGGIISIVFTIYFGDMLNYIYIYFGTNLQGPVNWFLFAASEEAAKLATLLVTVKVGGIGKEVAPGYVSVVSPRELFSLAFAVGLGFQIIENFIYFSRFVQMSKMIEFTFANFIFAAAYRTSFLAHAIWCSASALALWIPVLRDGGNMTVKQFFYAIAASSILHCTWNNFAARSDLNLGDIPINRVHILVWIASMVVVFCRLRKAQA